MRRLICNKGTRDNIFYNKNYEIDELKDKFSNTHH